MPGFDGDCLEDRLSAALVHPLLGGFPPPGCPLPHCLYVGSGANSLRYAYPGHDNEVPTADQGGCFLVTQARRFALVEELTLADGAAVAANQLQHCGRRS